MFWAACISGGPDRSAAKREANPEVYLTMNGPSEFHVVGDTIKQYASEDATVVVGYVIDPEMTDQIRVTVVATGIGRPMAVRGLPPGTQPANSA